MFAPDVARGVPTGRAPALARSIASGNDAIADTPRSDRHAIDPVLTPHASPNALAGPRRARARRGRPRNNNAVDAGRRARTTQATKCRVNSVFPSLVQNGDRPTSCLVPLVSYNTSS